MWEKIEEKLKELGKQNSGIKKLAMDWAKNAALQHHTDKMAGKEGKNVLLQLHKTIQQERKVRMARYC